MLRRAMGPRCGEAVTEIIAGVFILGLVLGYLSCELRRWLNGGGK